MAKDFCFLLCYDTGEEQTGVVMLLHEEGPFTSLGECTQHQANAMITLDLRLPSMMIPLPPPLQYLTGLTPSRPKSFLSWSQNIQTEHDFAWEHNPET